MESFVGGNTWTSEVSENKPTISDYFEKSSFGKPYRYGDSFVYRVYKTEIKNNQVTLKNDETGNGVTKEKFNSELFSLVEFYGKVINLEIKNEESTYSQGLFYMESQLEDCIIQNWNESEFGKRYDLIIEDGELLSQQYRTAIGPIDILATDKNTGEYVVIELKRNQTSDQTIGQIARYMQWVDENLNKGVKGVIVCGKWDEKLDYARKRMGDVEVLLYEVNFSLKEYKK